MFWLFAVFIPSCGLTHVVGIWNLYNNDYAAEATIKAITAAANVPTAILLWPLLPRMLAIPSPSMLQRKIEELGEARADRDRLLEELRTVAAQRERNEAALVQANKMEAAGQLTGGIAMTSTMLQPISGNMELIALAPEQSDKVARWATNASHAAERSTKLTGQLLTFSRPQRLEARPIPVAALLDGMIELLRNSVGPTIDLTVVTATDRGSVRSDPTQLELAILNLAINGRDAMPAGRAIRVVARRHDPDLIAIDVIDEGVGMPAGVAARARSLLHH